MKLLIQKVHSDEISIIYQILVRCGEEMYNKLNLSHWYPYMSEENFRASLENKILYGIYIDNIPIGTFNISTEARDYYYNSLWNIPANNKALYFGQLAIDPALQGNGIAKWCMQQLDNLAIESGCDVIRFDAVKMHPWLKDFYEKLDYSSCGTVKPKDFELLCFEKKLINI